MVSCLSRNLRKALTLFRWSCDLYMSSSVAAQNILISRVSIWECYLLSWHSGISPLVTSNYTNISVERNKSWKIINSGVDVRFVSPFCPSWANLVHVGAIFGPKPIQNGPKHKKGILRPSAEVALMQKICVFYTEKNFHMQFSDKTAFLVRSWVGFEVEIAYALILTEHNKTFIVQKNRLHTSWNTARLRSSHHRFALKTIPIVIMWQQT